MTLSVRWLGKVGYDEALALQRALHADAGRDHLLLLEHPHVYTLGKRADPEHVLVPPSSVGAQLVRTDRGGDVTYHGPGQLVGYPIVTLEESPAGMRDVIVHVRRLEALLIEVLARFGVEARRDDEYTGVWVGDEKIAAIGVRVARGRTMHGFALNVSPDLAMFDHIVPCGIRGRGVTSLAALLGDAVPSMREVVDAVVDAVPRHLGVPVSDRQDVSWARPAVPVAIAGADRFRRPEWMKVRADLGPGYRELKRLVKEESLHTVCEEAGCPNIFECWSQRTATFMILGERCTRACGFCLVDTRKPLPIDRDEPERVADAVAHLGLRHAVITSVARDDAPDGGAAIFAETIRAIRRRNPRTTVEVLIPDCKGNTGALDAIFAAKPDVLNHNLETVARLQRLVRPSAAYARSLAVLARAKAAGLVVKSGLMVGLGETESEVRGAITDLRSVGVDLLTLGQYLRPSAAHLPVSRWWTPAEFDALGAFARGLGFAHVESGPLVRSSYHARAGADAARGAPTPVTLSRTAS